MVCKSSNYHTPEYVPSGFGPIDGQRPAKRFDLRRARARSLHANRPTDRQSIQSGIAAAVTGAAKVLANVALDGMHITGVGEEKKTLRKYEQLAQHLPRASNIPDSDCLIATLRIL